MWHVYLGRHYAVRQDPSAWARRRAIAASRSGTSFRVARPAKILKSRVKRYGIQLSYL